MYTISHCISFMRELTPRAKLMSDCFLQFRACSPMPCIGSVQLPQSYPTFCDPMNCSTPVFPVHHQLWSLKISCTSSRWYHPTVSSSLVHFSFLPSIFPSIRVFSNESPLHTGGQSTPVHWQYILRDERRILQMWMLMMLRWRGSFWVFPGRPSAITNTFIKGRQRNFPCDPVVRNQYRGHRFDLWLEN